MEHDNYDPNLVFDMTMIKRGLPKINGLYFVYLRPSNSNPSMKERGLLFMEDGEWKSHPSKYSVDNATVNSNFLGCVGPFPIDI